MAHGINANLVHKWRARAMKQQTAAAETGSAAFIPVPLPTTGMTPVAAELRIEVRRGAMTATVCWLMSPTAECAAWLREVLQGSASTPSGWLPSLSTCALARTPRWRA
jgi:transposase